MKEPKKKVYECVICDKPRSKTGFFCPDCLKKQRGEATLGFQTFDDEKSH